MYWFTRYQIIGRNRETTQEGEENALNHRLATFVLRPLDIHDTAEAPRTNGPRIRHGNKLEGIGDVQNTYGHKEERDENKRRIITCPLIAASLDVTNRL